jgi:hypothetical protein
MYDPFVRLRICTPHSSFGLNGYRRVLAACSMCVVDLLSDYQLTQPTNRLWPILEPLSLAPTLTAVKCVASVGLSYFLVQICLTFALQRTFLVYVVPPSSMDCQNESSILLPSTSHKVRCEAYEAVSLML